jgi:hypothetical protein
MPTSFLRPVSEGTNTDFVLGAGASKTAAVDPGAGPTPSHDGDTSRVEADGSASFSQSFVVSGKPVRSTAKAITSVSVGVRAMITGDDDNGALGLRVLFTGVGTGPTVSTGFIGHTYADYGPSAVLAPGSVAFTPAHLQNQWEIGWNSPGFGPGVDLVTDVCRVTTAWGVIVWTAHAGSLDEILARSVGPRRRGSVLAAIGGGLALAHMPDLAAAIARETGVQYAPDELLAEIRTMRRRSFCFLAGVAAADLLIP